MNADILLKHFNRISETAGATPRIRRFILDLAVRGKLVDQDLNDEPAAELLKRIAAIKKSTAKKGKKNKSSEIADTPFELPETWRWSQLASIGYISPRNDASIDVSASFVPMPLISSEYGIPVQHECRLWGEIKSRYTHFAEGDVGLAKITPCFENGKSTVFRGLTGGIGAGTTELHIVRPIYVDPDYILIFLKCSHFIGSGIPKMTGTAGQKRIPTDYFAFTPFPVPPLAEQARIVAKVNELMSLCDWLEASLNKREFRRTRLVKSSLNRISIASSDDVKEATRFHLNHLSRLTARVEHINSLRETILTLAMRGLLAPQDSNDEPATELLKQIKKEKARLVKEKLIKEPRPTRVIKTEEEPYSLPSGWTWVRIWDVAQLITSGSRDWAKYYSKTGAMFVTMSNLSRGSYELRLDTKRYVNPPANGEGSRTKLEADDLLISITGDVGNLGRVPADFGEAYINQHTCLLRFMPLCRNRYFPELLRSPLAEIQFDGPQRGIKNSFRLGDVGEMIIPLPPLAEQHRIVARVDELMTICDQLEIQLTETEERNYRLLVTVLNKALNTSTETIS